MLGRPKKAQEDRREKSFRVRLTDTEKKTIDEAANVSALDSSTWARQVLIAAARKVIKEATKS